MSVSASTRRVAKGRTQSSAIPDHPLIQEASMPHFHFSEKDSESQRMHRAVDATPRLPRRQHHSRVWNGTVKHALLSLVGLLGILLIVSLSLNLRLPQLKYPKAEEQLTTPEDTHPPPPPQWLPIPQLQSIERTNIPVENRPEPIPEPEAKPPAHREERHRKQDVPSGTAEKQVKPQEEPPKRTSPITGKEKKIMQAKIAEKKVDAILKETRRILDSILVNSVERHYLEEAFQSISQLKKTHSMLLMDNATRVDFGLQVSALKATCLYLKASIEVRANIMELKGYLENVFGSPKKLDKIVFAHIGVSIKSIKMGEFLERQPFTAKEKMFFLSDEAGSFESVDQKRKDKLTSLLTPFMFKMGNDSTRKTLDTRIKELESAGEGLRTAVFDAQRFLDEARMAFPIDNLKSLHAFNMFRDLIQKSADVMRTEITIWAKIARGEKPLSILDVYKYHDSVAVATISYDSCVRLRNKALLPRDLLGLLSPLPSLQSSELKSFEALKQAFITWGNGLIGVQLLEATLTKPASVRAFDFTGLLWRRFADSWLLRDEEARHLIMRTNQGLLGRDDKPFAFVEAVKKMYTKRRPSLDKVPVDWHALPDTSKVQNQEN